MDIGYLLHCLSSCWLVLCMTTFSAQLFALCEENDIPATFFELTTVLAFYYFVERGADMVKPFRLFSPPAFCPRRASIARCEGSSKRGG